MFALPVAAISIDQLDQFLFKLDRHDWTYNYSDDHSVWRKGVANERLILEEAKAHPALQELVDAYNRFYFKHQNHDLLKSDIEIIRKKFQ